MIRRRKPELPAAHINLTSLLDITFVLLISFMVVAPALRYNVDLELPKVSRSNSSEPKKPITVQIDRNGDYFVNGEVMALDEIPGGIKATPEFLENAPVALEIHKEVSWDYVAPLINELKSNDINSIGIVTEKGN